MLKVPQDIHLAYQIDSSKLMEQLLEWLKPLKKQELKKNTVLGLFGEDAEFIDQMTEIYRKNNSHQPPSQQAYAAAMQDYLSRPAKPLKDSQESYPLREELYDRGQFC
jgi:hypothetical protein